MSPLIRYIGGLALVISLAICGQAKAISVAVFPVDDLSKDYNSMSSEMYKFITHEIQGKGLEVISSEKVMGYVTARRIREIGYLNTVEIMEARNVLGADLVLLASVCQQNKKSGVFGMTLALVRTSDGKAVWADSKGVSLVDEQRFLGVNSPAGFDDLVPILAKKLFDDWPVDLDFTAGRELAGEQIASTKDKAYTQVESVYFSPKFVKPGEEVSCTIRFKNNYVGGEGAKVFVKVGSRVYLASSDDGIYYKAVWVSPAGSSDERLKVASLGNDSLILKGVWTGDAKDASYPVSLIFDWPSGKREESYLGSYVVDSVPPKFSLKPLGKFIDGIIAFRDQVQVAVRFQRNEPIEKWEFMVRDIDGGEILSARGSKQVPEMFRWHGQTKDGHRAAKGYYSISLKVIDRAGNSSEETGRVMLLDKLPGVEVEVEKTDSVMVATLSQKDQVPVVSWRMELWSRDNILMTILEGETLPAEVKLADLSDNLNKGKIDCVLAVRDSLGSRAKINIDNLLSKLIIADDQDAFDDEAGKAKEWDIDF